MGRALYFITNTTSIVLCATDVWNARRKNKEAKGRKNAGNAIHSFQAAVKTDPEVDFIENRRRG